MRDHLEQTFLVPSRAFLPLNKHIGKRDIVQVQGFSLQQVTNHISFIRPTDDRISSNPWRAIFIKKKS